MKVASYLLAAAAASMVAAPAFAAPANPAASLSIAKQVRAGAPVAKKSRLAGVSTWIAVLGAIAVVAGVGVIAGTSGDGFGDQGDSN